MLLSGASSSAGLGNHHLCMTLSTYSVMTSPRRNSEFCFHQSLNIEVARGNNLITVSRGGNHFKVFCSASQLKTRTPSKEIICFTPAGS